jgi:signal transduction histidine kinase
MTLKQVRRLLQSVGADHAEHAHSQPLRRAATLLERTDRQILRLGRLVSDLVDVSRIQAGKLEMRPEACELAAIVREAVREQVAAWPQRAIALMIPPHLDAHITADPDRIGQVVTNYLTNALKYSPDDTKVVVTVQADDGRGLVEVRDHGQGLDMGQQMHLFERFYRAPGIEQQSGSGVGLGLGLHICKTIIERHGGSVGVTSVPGEGSVFWFALPLDERAESRGSEERLRW